MPRRYELDCVDCSFRTTVVGEFETVIEAVRAHQHEEGAGPTDHFVNVHRRE